MLDELLEIGERIDAFYKVHTDPHEIGTLVSVLMIAQARILLGAVDRTRRSVHRLKDTMPPGFEQDMMRFVDSMMREVEDLQRRAGGIVEDGEPTPAAYFLRAFEYRSTGRVISELMRRLGWGTSTQVNAASSIDITKLGAKQNATSKEDDQANNPG